MHVIAVSGSLRLYPLEPFLVAFQSGAVDVYRDLPPEYQATVGLGGPIVLGLVVLGLLPEFSTRVIRTIRRSPVISTIFGVPGALALAALLYIGTLITDSSLGVFFAIPLVSVGVTLLPAAGVLGLVAIGVTIASRVKLDNLAAGLVVGAALVAAGTVVPAVAILVGTLAVVLGVGAGFRVLLGSGVRATREERPVPPSSKI